jgi:uncharacterized protein (DUF58 family)
VTPAVTPKFTSWLALASAAVFAGLLLGRPELVAVAAPLIVALLLGSGWSDAPELSVALAVDKTRCIEGDDVEVAITIESVHGVDELQVGLVLPFGFRVATGGLRWLVCVRQGQPRVIQIPLHATRWGSHDIGFVVLRAFGPGRFIQYEGSRDLQRVVKVYPSVEAIRTAVAPPRTQVFTGNYVSKMGGEGIEFADVRRFSHGDSVRRVNWRVTSRRDELHVNLFSLERNADVLLFLDSFSDIGPPGMSSLDLTIRGAANLARHYLAHRDRVGLVNFGGMLNWLTASMGRGHLYRIVEHLLDVRTMLSHSWKDIDVLPRRTLPPLALVVAFSPLVDERAVKAMTDLHARRFPLLIVDTLPEHVVEPTQGFEKRVAYRAWKLKRAALRFDLAASGMPVVQWAGDRPLESALADAPRFLRGVPLPT